MSEKSREEILEELIDEQGRRITELERRATLTVGTIPCGGCGGPHRFDTSLPSVAWNEVIRSQGMSEFLCTSCILREFGKLRRNFTARLWGDGFSGLPVEIKFSTEVANDFARLDDENTELRSCLFGLIEAWAGTDRAMEQAEALLKKVCS